MLLDTDRIELFICASRSITALTGMVAGNVLLRSSIYCLSVGSAGSSIYATLLDSTIPRQRFQDQSPLHAFRDTVIYAVVCWFISSTDDSVM
jgi:hypothetical protein